MIFPNYIAICLHKSYFFRIFAVDFVKLTIMEGKPCSILVPIVGLRHFVSDVDATLAELLPGREIMLTPDRGNRRDKTAIQAWADGRQIGFVSSDFTEIIHVNYPDFRGLRVEVAENEIAIEDNAFYVEVELTTLELPPYAPTIESVGLHGIALPGFQQAKEVALMDIAMRCEQVEEFFDGVHVDEGVVESLIDIARRFDRIYGHSLSGSERRVYIRLMLLMSAAMTYWTQNCFDLYEEMLGLIDKRREFARDPETAAQVMEAEKENIHAEMSDFIGEIDALIRSGLTTRADLYEENEQWLRALPDHLYAHLANPAELAARLLYLRLDTAELHTIYAHLILREWLKDVVEEKISNEELKKEKCVEKKAKSERVKAKKQHPGFQYWEPGLPDYRRKGAIKKMRDAMALSPNQPTARLAECIRSLQEKGLLLRNISPIREFTEQLNVLLGTAIKPDTLSRHLSKKQ